jgi:DNA excision repair protein ERCC-4
MKVTPKITLTIDTREPWPHPWAPLLPETQLVQATLETGDIALAGAETGAVVERKTLSDFLACIGQERARFDKELLRARYVTAFCIVVESTLVEALHRPSGLHPAAIVGSIAAWTRRGFPVVFAGSPRLAADFTFRYLIQQITEARRMLKAVEPTETIHETQ